MVDPLDTIYWRDEILQVMYWLRGEKLNQRVTAQNLAVFLPASAAFLQTHLEQLTADGYLQHDNKLPISYELTAQGIEEGGRRFGEEFSALTRQAHGACSNPNCSCHALGPEACTTHP